MEAIIRSLTSGEYFRATLDDSGDVAELSGPLPIMDATDRDTMETDWAAFEDAEVSAWDDADDRRSWTADRIAVVHTF